jgi:hypothetical protein
LLRTLRIAECVRKIDEAPQAAELESDEARTYNAPQIPRVARPRQ